MHGEYKAQLIFNKPINVFSAGFSEQTTTFHDNSLLEITVKYKTKQEVNIMKPLNTVSIILESCTIFSGIATVPVVAKDLDEGHILHRWCLHYKESDGASNMPHTTCKTWRLMIYASVGK